MTGPNPPSDPTASGRAGRSQTPSQSQGRPTGAQPRALRQVALLVVGMGAAMLAVGLALVATAHDGSSTRIVGLALCGVGVLDLLSSGALLAVAGRRAQGEGYDGQPVTYQPGDRPPGML